MAEPIVGEQIGSYEIRKLLGKGGMGAVYLAHDHSLDRQVAIKMLPHHLSQNPDIVTRFQREARALAKLRHPNLMHIYTVGQHKGHPFFAMEYVRGSTLASIIDRTGRLPPAQAAHIVADVLSALDKVHQAGMMHRDIKPGNIMIDEDGRAVLMDFGLAREETDVGMTADHTVLGTPSYMSPEQAAGERVDARTDLYSIGIVLYEMLTGRPPFAGKTSFEILRQHIESSVPPPSERAPEVPPGLDAVVARAVAKSSDDRFQTVAQMAAALAGVYRDATLLRLATEAGRATEPTVLTAPPGPGFASTVAVTRTAAAPTVRSRTPGSRWTRRALLAAAVGLAAVSAWLMFKPSRPASPPAPAGAVHFIEVRCRDLDPVRGWLLGLEVLDDGRTIIKIEDESGQSREFRMEKEDVFRVLRSRE